MNFPFKILVIDDEDIYTSEIQFFLKKNHFIIETANNGTVAWEMFQQYKYPIVITDLRMPKGLDGLDVLANIKKLNPHSQVIVITGHGNDNEELKIWRLHAFHYFEKPFSLDNLLLKVKEAIELYERLEGIIDLNSEISKPEGQRMSLEEVRKMLSEYPNLTSDAILKARSKES